MKNKVRRDCASDCDDEAVTAPYYLTYQRWLRLAMGGDCVDESHVWRVCVGDCDDGAVPAPYDLTYRR